MGENLTAFTRTEALLGIEAIERLKKAKVAVFGIGGVGSFAAEALARCGIGQLDLIDPDVVSVTNINRQLIATEKTVGIQKTKLMKERVEAINSNSTVREFPVFFGVDTLGEFDFASYDYILDAIDTLTSKILLITEAKNANVPIISCMGSGNKLDPTSFLVADIEKTSVCPLAKIMRKELKKRGIRGVKVVYSKELPRKPADSGEKGIKKNRPVLASVSFVPSVAGLIMAGEVIKDIAGVS